MQSQHQLCSFVHLMGGSVRKDVVSSVTHVVANTVFGSKYKVILLVKILDIFCCVGSRMF